MNPIDEVLIALRRVIRATDIFSRHLMKSSGLTAPQLLVMQTIRNESRTTGSALAKRVSVSQATLTTILDRLENKGYINRERSENDKRKVMVSLTDAGLDAIKGSPQPLQESFIRQFQNLQDWEKTQIISSLQRVAQMMDAQHLDASPVLDVGELDRGEEESTPSFID
ncbi:MAG: MarR family transcriptional regulator [Pseudomonadales bacterium]|nr:MarR family transcriptional regulator [Pseudomonadales bacterium]